MSIEQDEARRVERAMEEVSEGADEPMEVDLHPDRVRRFGSINFSRMRTRWNRDEADVIQAAHAQVEHELLIQFGDVYQILNNLYDVVREQMVDEQTGELMVDERGFARWAVDQTGMPIEDWSRLTERDKEHFLHQITTRMVGWEQRAADHWGSAMFAKAMWEDQFSENFTGAPQVAGKRPTEADRTQHAQGASREQRYLGIYMSLVSRKAEALVRSMERLSQRLKDTSR